MPTSSSQPITLERFPELCRQQLTEFFASRRPGIAEIGAPVVRAASYLESFALGGGKRIRPLYAWAGFVGSGGPERVKEEEKAVLRAVSSLELIQACALIHDDIIDHSDQRRGEPTVHRRVARLHRDNGWRRCAEDFGEAVAILVGDLALVYAEDMLQDSGLSAEALARAREPWRAMRAEVIGGQLLDISLEATGEEDIDLAERVNRFKTAAYTIERPLHLGAMIADAPKPTVSAFRGYGRDIGVAYQLRDDLLGVFGDPSVTGKPAGDDLREGKRTVLLALALHAADEHDPAAARVLRDKVGRTSDAEDVARLAEIIEATGAAQEVEHRISRLVERGLEQLDHANIAPDVRDLLHRLAIASTVRRK